MCFQSRKLCQGFSSSCAYASVARYRSKAQPHNIIDVQGLKRGHQLNMKILTVNFLTCAVRACKTSPLSFPLHFQDAELEQSDMEYNVSFLWSVLPRIDWEALKVTAKEVCVLYKALIKLTFTLNKNTSNEEDLIPRLCPTALSSSRPSIPYC